MLLIGIFLTVLSLTAAGSLGVLLVLGMKKLFGKRLGARWNYLVWLLPLALYLVPVYLPQGEHPVPPALQNLPGRVILGRVGAVTGKVDLESLLYAARRRPEWTFVLMGRATKPAAQQLQGQDNIILTGPVNSLDLPDCLCRCDVLFDLARLDRRGSDVVPPTIYEYFAAGKPVAAVTDPNVPDPYPQLIHSAYDGAGFLRACRDALDEDPSLSAQRRAFAQQSSWAERAAQVASIFEAVGLF